MTYSGVRTRMILLSLVSLGGMAVLMLVIVWQMQKNLIDERKQLIQAQVQSAVSLADAIHARVVAGELPEEAAKRQLMSSLVSMKYLDNGYFWILDRDGILLMNPYAPDSVGESLVELRDSNGQFFIRAFIDTARDGGGFIPYDWPRPDGGTPIAKVAYVADFEPWHWVIGSGLYIEDLHQDAVRQIATGTVIIFILFGLSVAASLALSRRFIHSYRNSAIHDPLTDLYNRQYLNEVGVRMINRAKRAVESHVTAIFLDIDHFKKINDTYGHECGDAVLQTLGVLLQNSLRPGELAFRYGGEELVVLLQASEEEGRAIAERIRTAIGKHPFRSDDKTFNVTVSAGVALSRPDDELPELLHRADNCMYVAKTMGRNRTVTESETQAGKPVRPTV